MASSLTTAIEPPPFGWSDVDSIAPTLASGSTQARRVVAQERLDAMALEQYLLLVARERAKERRAAELADKARREATQQSRVSDGASFLLDVPPIPPAIWGRDNDVLWMAGEALMIAGPQGVGKTTLLGQILKGLLGLTPTVLGFPVKPVEKRVLYLAMDRPQQAARNLNRIFRGCDREVLAEKLRVWSGPPLADFATQPEALVQMCLEHEAGAVLIDSVKDAAVGLAKDEVGAGYNRARQMALAEGVEVLELHHQRKSGDNGGKPTTLNDVFGSTWITAGTGSVVLLWGEAGDPVVEFIHLKQPANVVGPFNIVHDQDTGISTVRVDQDRDILAMARRCPSGLSVKDAASVLFGEEDPDDKQVEKARRKLRDYVKKGHLVEKAGGPGRGNSARWYAVAYPDDVGREPPPDLAEVELLPGRGECGTCGNRESSGEHKILCVYRDFAADEVADLMGCTEADVARVRAAQRDAA